MSRLRRKKRLTVKKEDRLTEKPPKPMGWKNVLTLPNHKVNFRKEDVVLLAPGPLAIPFYIYVSKDDEVLAVNGGVTVPDLHESAIFKIAIWFVQDPRTVDSPYFKPAEKKFRGIRIFQNTAAARLDSFRHAIAGKFYTFDIVTPEASAQPFTPPKWRYRTDTTVLGSAIWFLYKSRVKRVRLIGGDFTGPRYHDLTVNPKKAHWQETAVWLNQRDRLEKQIDWIHRNGGPIIETLSPSALRNVPAAIRVDAPKRVYVVAPGPSGVKHLNDIPKDAYVWLLNMMGAIFPDFNVPWTPSALVVSDKDCFYKEWWGRAMENFAQLHKTHGAMRLFSNGTVARAKCEVDLSFPIDTVDGWFLRSGGTVAGTALSMLYLSGVEEVVFVGVTMSGNQYANKSVNPDVRWLAHHGETWIARDVLDARIRYCRERGMEIYAMDADETKLTEVKPWSM